MEYPQIIFVKYGVFVVCLTWLKSLVCWSVNLHACSNSHIAFWSVNIHAFSKIFFGIFQFHHHDNCAMPITSKLKSNLELQKKLEEVSCSL
jgi:hypothetical protein